MDMYVLQIRVYNNIQGQNWVLDIFPPQNKFTIGYILKKYSNHESMEAWEKKV